MERDYYCRNKFRELAIHAEKKTTHNCYSAKSQPINFNWLKQNPGQIFNTDINISERKMMLQNIRNPGCETHCWQPEDQGTPSTRIIEHGFEKTHDNPYGSVEQLNFITGSNCNLTCSYCCKEFSTAWANDCKTNGSYKNIGQSEPNYTYATTDLIVSKVSQNQKFNMANYQMLLNEVSLCADDLLTFGISGGEPLLNNHLIELLQLVPTVPEIKVYTGLGVNIKRFESIIDKIKDYKNVTVAVSMENVGALHEFNRYGTQWPDMLAKLELLKQSKISVMFNSTLSNLTIFGFSEFYNQFKNEHIRTQVVQVPTFMPLYVIDDVSKQRIADDLANTVCDTRDEIIKSLETVPSPEQHAHLQSFLQQFIARRSDLSMDIFPQSFKDWVNKNVV